MSDGSIVAVAANSMSGAMSAAAMQPTADQAARFQQLLQQPGTTAEPTYYTVPPAATTALGTDLHAVVDYVGQVDLRFTATAASPEPLSELPDLPPEMQQDLQMQREFGEMIRNMGNANLEFQLVGKSIELAENLPKVLYQQG